VNTAINKALAAATLAACAAAATPVAHARAGIETGGNDVVVDYRDLDLARPEGRATLQGRLRAAARAVCGAPEREELRAMFARRDCYQLAIASAVRESGIGVQAVAAAR
jgi:UrcA family protein